MDQKRLILFAVLVFIGMMLYNAWQEESPKQAVKQAQASQAASATEVESRFPTFSDVGTTHAETVATAGKSQAAPSQSSELITVKTDVIEAKINRRGGNLVYLALLQYAEDLNNPKQPVVLFNEQPQSLYLAQSGIIEPGSSNNEQNALYQSESSSYQLEDGQNELKVALAWQHEGRDYQKNYVFKRGDYTVDLQYQVINNQGKPWQGQLVTQLTRKNTPPTPRGLFHLNTFFGASYSTAQDPYQKLTYKKMQKKDLDTSTEGGWVAMQQHYFLSAWVPSEQQQNMLYSRIGTNEVFTIGAMGPVLSAAANGGVATAKAVLYAGPEIPEVLKSVAPHLDLTVDYGWLWIISVLIFWLMDHIHSVVGNWGWSIVLVTVFIKALFYRLSSASYRSMANMRKIQPKLEALRERYGDDRQRLSQETLALYRKEKVNPLGGCLPILIQIPVFIALYWVLIASVELRQAPWVLWIHDLSVKDPYYILPLLMGISMFIQQKLNPPPPDPTQAKVMMLLPVFFTALFLNFPAGLVLYWVVNNSLSILQQWYIMRKFGDTRNNKPALTKAKAN